MTTSDYINKVKSILNEASETGDFFLGADTVNVEALIKNTFVESWKRIAGIVPKSWLTNKSFKNQTVVADTIDGTGYVILPDDFYMLNMFKMTGWKVSVFSITPETESVLRRQSNEYSRGSVIRPVVIQSASVTDRDEITCSITTKGNDYIIDEIVILTNGFTIKVLSVDSEGGVTKYEVLYSGNEITSSMELNQLQSNIEGSGLKLTVTSVSSGSEQNTILKYFSLPKGMTSHTIEQAIYIPVIDELTGTTIDISSKLLEPLAYSNAANVYTALEKYDTAKALETKIVELLKV